MKRILLFTVLISLFAVATARAQCQDLSSSAISSASLALRRAVTGLEADRAEARDGKPSVLLKVARIGNVSIAGPAPASPEEITSAVQICVDQANLEGRLREHAQSSVRFVAGSQFGDVVEALRRVEQVGLENIDVSTRNVLRIREINYLGYLRPRASATREGGRFSVTIDFSMDVVAVESGAIRTQRATRRHDVIAEYSVKLATGEIALPCGCHGPIMIGTVRPNEQCQSGADVAMACQFQCSAPNGYPMGVQWGTRCR